MTVDNQKLHNTPISVLIPTYNGEFWLDSLLKRLTSQDLIIAEIIIIDSGSQDKTCDIAQQYNVKLIQIKPEEFDHGATRTKLAKLATAEFLLFLTQDALPRNNQAIIPLIKVLQEQTRVAVAYGRQLATKQASPFSKHLRHFNYPPYSEIRFWKDRYNYGFKTIFCSNSFALYRKSLLKELNYFPQNILFGEDTLLAASFLRAGYGVAYVAEAQVYHSHNYTIFQELQRYFDIGVLHCIENHLQQDFGNVKGAGQRFVKSEFFFLYQARHYFLLPLSLLRNACKLLGYQLGKKHHRLPRKIVTFLSSHPRWWQ